MKKAVIISIVIIIVLVATTVGSIFLMSHNYKNLQKNAEITWQLSPTLIEQMRGKELDKFPYSPAPIQWNGKYFQVDDGHIVDGKGLPISFIYNRERNEKLNTDRFFSNSDIKGLVWQTSGVEVVGHYKDAFGQEEGDANQVYYVLSYLDLAQNAVIARDTILGSEPPKTTDNIQGATGKLPKEEDIINAIQLRVGK